MQPDGLMAGKTAVVTGAGSGLGRAVARGLARQQIRVVLVGRRVALLERTADAIGQSGGTALVAPADVADIDAVEALHSKVLAQWGQVDILVNAAGVFGPIQPIRDTDPRRWIETLAINTIGTYLTCRAFVGEMIDRGWGRIINFSSAASLHQPGPLNSAYGTSKVAMNQFTRHLAAELAGTGVTANVIHPGEVKTEMWSTIRDESQSVGSEGEGYRTWAADVGRTGGDDPQKTVDLIVHLLGDGAAATNGQFLWIADGIQKPLPSW
jgi:NAD(P)-dependent dehydrogenase (short-subunit alcohol dehydrogenase family)